MIAIIAILAALLMPALKNAREMAKSTQCLNTLKQIGYAYQLYTNDNNGLSPPTNPAIDPVYAWENKPYHLLCSYLGYRRSDPGRFWRCSKEPPYPASPEYPPISYGTNNRLKSLDGSGIDFMKNGYLFPADAASKTILLGDARNWNINPDLLQVNFRHSGRTCFVFYDGHGQSLSPDQTSGCW